MKVLLIDDDPNTVEIVSLGLQLLWPEVELVSTHLGESGIEMVKSESPDIVILDIGLPDISGFEVLKQVRLFSGIPVIVLTVWGQKDQIARGLELGADDYMVKPFKLVELLARMKALTMRQSGGQSEERA